MIREVLGPLWADRGSANNAGVRGGTTRGSRDRHHDGRLESDAGGQERVTGVFSCTKAVFPMVAQRRKSRIVNISSAGKRGGRHAREPAAAAKGGVNAFTKSIARGRRAYAISSGQRDPHRQRLKRKCSQALPREHIDKLPDKYPAEAHRESGGKLPPALAPMRLRS